jgi:hypothetical protein
MEKMLNGRLKQIIEPDGKSSRNKVLPLLDIGLKSKCLVPTGAFDRLGISL